MAAPVLAFYTTAGVAAPAVDFSTIPAGQESTTLELILWNNKPATVLADTATNVVVSVRNEVVSSVDDPVAQGWVLAKSNGVENPNNVSNVYDDAQVAFVPINSVQDLEIGNIPNGCGRHIFLKVVVPSDASTQAGIRLRVIAGSSSLSRGLPYFFNRAFGDGIVDNLVRQTFPPILDRKVGVWTDVVVQVAGRYTGNTAKKFLVKVVAGTSPGYFTYSCSDDDGSSYSSTLTSSTGSFTAVYTSLSVSEGVTIRWIAGTSQSVAAGDQWAVYADIVPFALKPGISSALQGQVGFGEALVYGNRVLHQSPSSISGLTASKFNYVVLNADGTLEADTSANHQIGSLVLGWMLTDTQKVVSTGRLAPLVTMGLDLWDDFAPLWQTIGGLTWAYNRGKFRKFDALVRIPGATSAPYATFSLVAHTNNYIQVDPLTEQVVNYTGIGYIGDNIPLFNVLTGGTYIQSWSDDRTKLGVSILKNTFVSTLSSIATGTSSSFSLTSFANRGLIRKLIVTPSPTGSGYTLSFYKSGTYDSTTLEYSAGTLSGVFTDSFLWFHEDTTNTRTLKGFVQNSIGITTTFTIEIEHERYS